MRGKRAKAIRKLVYRGQTEDRKYVAQEHLLQHPVYPELNIKRYTVFATGLRRVYLDCKRTLKNAKTGA